MQDISVSHYRNSLDFGAYIKIWLLRTLLSTHLCAINNMLFVFLNFWMNEFFESGLSIKSHHVFLRTVNFRYMTILGRIFSKKCPHFPPTQLTVNSSHAQFRHSSSGVGVLKISKVSRCKLKLVIRLLVQNRLLPSNENTSKPFFQSFSLSDLLVERFKRKRKSGY